MTTLKEAQKDMSEMPEQIWAVDEVRGGAQGFLLYPATWSQNDFSLGTKYLRVDAAVKITPKQRNTLLQHAKAIEGSNSRMAKLIREVLG